MRGSTGTFVATRAVNLGLANSALVIEALAWRAAMVFANVLRLDSFTVQGDSQLMDNILQEG